MELVSTIMFSKHNYIYFVIFLQQFLQKRSSNGDDRTWKRNNCKYSSDVTTAGNITYKYLATPTTTKDTASTVTLATTAYIIIQLINDDLLGRRWQTTLQRMERLSGRRIHYKIIIKSFFKLAHGTL